jgi:hypothetical protein
LDGIKQVGLPAANNARCGDDRRGGSVGTRSAPLQGEWYVALKEDTARRVAEEQQRLAEEQRRTAEDKVAYERSLPR